MKNIHVLPTDKPSRLFIIDGKLYNYHKPQQGDGVNEINQHIYITSDEEINQQTEPCWCINTIKNTWDADLIYYQGSMPQYHYVGFKKIIITTDQDLIADGVQAIDDEFLEWFVKNANESGVPFDRCEVEVEFIQTPDNLKDGFYYKITIPQKEAKQEIVINEKCSKCGSSQYQIGKPFCTDEFCNTNIGKASEDYWLKQPYNEDAFVEGAKWMAERMYSEKNMKQFAFECVANFLSNNDNKVEMKLVDVIIDRINNGFEQFKKK